MLLKSFIPNEFSLLFSRRFRDLEIDCRPACRAIRTKFGPYPAAESTRRPTSDCEGSHFLERLVGESSLLELKRLLLPLPHSTPMGLLRTQSNGWFTSKRMHEPEALSCMFGCDANDDLCHYLKCEALWTCVYSCFSCNTSIFTQINPARACVHNVNVANISRLYTAYSS